jgi:hypothetical protein
MGIHMTDIKNEILHLTKAQVRGIVTAMMKGNDSFDDREVVRVILAFASSTQASAPEYPGLEQIIINEAFEAFNGFCISADPENIRPDNLKYFNKFFPKSKHPLKPKA